MTLKLVLILQRPLSNSKHINSTNSRSRSRSTSSTPNNNNNNNNTLYNLPRP